MGPGSQFFGVGPMFQERFGALLIQAPAAVGKGTQAEMFPHDHRQQQCVPRQRQDLLLAFRAAFQRRSPFFARRPLVRFVNLLPALNKWTISSTSNPAIRSAGKFRVKAVAVVVTVCW